MGSEYYDGINREEDKQVKLQDTVDKWWNGLSIAYKTKLTEGYNLLPQLVNVDELWSSLDWNDKWDIYTGDHDEVIDHE